MIIKQGEDSIYIAADTLFSAKLSDLYVVAPSSGGDSIRVAPQSPEISDSLTNTAADSTAAAGSLIKDSAAVLKEIPLPSSTNPEEKAAVRDSVPQVAVKNIPDRVEQQLPIAPVLAPAARKNDTTRGKAALNSPANFATNDSTNRYFEAFHNVRIFSDSVQAVSDSLFYSFRDSTFRLYYEPAIWGKNSQITGDTILLHTKNKQMDRFEAFKNGFMVNQVEGNAFNQVKSTRIDGYFTNGNMDSLRAKGSAESIYFVQDDDSAYIGINEVTADIIDAYFANKELHKVVYRTEATGTMWPIKDKSPEEMRLKGFTWREAERPKTKYDLMQ